ncbi:MAG: transposase [Bacillales bacterium]|nr:transposase [Bacillales bacterium]
MKKHATPHIFRYTHISVLAEAGVDLPTIMKRVGHNDRETTMKIYIHVTEKMKKNASEKIKIHFENILNLTNLKGKNVVVDRWEPLHKAVHKAFPHAQTMVDKYHVIQKVTQAFDQVRKKIPA